MKLKEEQKEYVRSLLDKAVSITGIISLMSGKGWLSGVGYGSIRKEIVKEIDRYTKEKKDRRKTYEWVECQKCKGHGRFKVVH